MAGALAYKRELTIKSFFATIILDGLRDNYEKGVCIVDFKRLTAYTVETDENKLKITLHRPTRSDYIAFFVLYAILMAAPIFLTIAGFSGIGGASTGHAVISIVMIALLIIALPMYFIEMRKLRKNFRFVLDENGVTIADLEGEYLIRWSDVEMFGLVNHTYRPGRIARNRYLIYDSCMYFTVENEDEYFVRKQCIRSGVRSQFYGKATDTTIVLTLDLRNAQEEYNAFRKYIYKYCDKQKEKCFIEVLK